MDTGFLRVASIWFQWVIPIPLASGPMITWPRFSPRPSSVVSATVTLRESSCKQHNMVTQSAVWAWPSIFFFFFLHHSFKSVNQLNVCNNSICYFYCFCCFNLILLAFNFITILLICFRYHIWARIFFLDLNSSCVFLKFHLIISSFRTSLGHSPKCHLQDDGRHREDHGFIKDGVCVVPFGGSLLFADLPAVLQEIHFHKWIWWQKRVKKITTEF